MPETAATAATPLLSLSEILRQADIQDDNTTATARAALMNFYQHCRSTMLGQTVMTAEDLHRMEAIWALATAPLTPRASDYAGNRVAAEAEADGGTTPAATPAARVMTGLDRALRVRGA